MISFAAALLCLGVSATFTANNVGNPQELSASSDVCEGRSSNCSVLLDVPSVCAGSSSSCPIAFMFHGHGGSNKMFRNNPYVHDANFIGVYPQGELYEGRSGWNDGSMDGNQCAYNDYTCTKDPNDGLFVAGIVAVLQSMGATGRFYAYGSSNGANEVQILASNSCDDLPISGIAAHSGQLLSSPARSAGAPYDYNQPCSGSQPCNGGRAVAQLSIHGDADPVIKYDGGSRLGSDVFILMDEPSSDKLWADQNKCTGSLSQSTVSANARNTGSTTATYFVWGGCPATAPVEYYKVAGASHVATTSLDNKDERQVVFDFFTKVEEAHGSSIIV